MNDYLDLLNPAQRQAVENIDGPSLVIAGAGSGKTRVLTYRIAHLLRLGKNPNKILALTFTNKAAKEMKERIGALVGKDIVRYLWMGTFHSIFARILRYEAERIGYPKNYTIYDTVDSKNLIKKILKELQLDDKMYKPNDVLARISYAKNNLITADAYLNSPKMQEIDLSQNRPKMGKIYKIYTQRCVKAAAMDFDDLLLNTNILFKKNPDILEKYQQRFDYVLVDEYQDTNYAQYLIIKKLSEKHRNICVVGDDSQSIYSFRGARIENILNFQKDYKDNRIFKLEQNYRSTKTIVDASNSIIEKNKNKIPKKVWSNNDDGAKIKIVQNMVDSLEGKMVANSIMESRLTDHFNLREYAILYRTNAQSRIFEEALRRNGIPYKIYSGISFYQRKEIKDLLAYFRLVVNHNDDEALKRVINYPKRGIGNTTLARLEAAATQMGISIWKAMLAMDKLDIKVAKATQNRMMEFAKMIYIFAQQIEKTDAYDLAHDIASKTGLLKDLYQDRSPEGVSRHENVQELLSGIKDFTTQNSSDDGKPVTLDMFLQEVALMTNQDADDEDDDRVVLMTIHSAKGLEFNNVYIVGLEEGLFPSEMSSHTAHELEEERRLFYVAVTRAKKNLILSYASSRFRWGETKESPPSRFIEEIDKKYIDVEQSFDSINFGKKTSPMPQQSNRKKTFTPKKSKPKSPFSPQSKTPFETPNRKFVKMSKAEDVTPKKNFTDDDNRRIKPGVTVRHERFGKGTVMNLEGEPPNTKAFIDFGEKGKRQLLLKFAKLNVLG